MAIKYTTPEVAKNTTSRDIEALAAQECKLQEKSVEYTQNAEFVVTPDEGYDGMSKVNVTVNVTNPMNTYDITQAVVNLYRFTRTSVPANVVG